MLFHVLTAFDSTISNNSKGKVATRNSLYQLIGRAGRTGKSHKAKVLFQDFDTMRKALLPGRYSAYKSSCLSI